MIEIVISFIIIKGPDFPQVDPETGDKIISVDMFTEELNIFVRYDTHEILLLGLLFVLLAMVSPFDQSDVLCEKASLFTSAGSIVMIILQLMLCSFTTIILKFQTKSISLS